MPGGGMPWPLSRPGTAAEPRRVPGPGGDAARAGVVCQPRQPAHPARLPHRRQRVHRLCRRRTPRRDAPNHSRSPDRLAQRPRAPRPGPQFDPPKLAAVASLFDHLCEVNAVSHNPVRGVKRPRSDANEGKTPALGDGQARALLEAPPASTLKGKRDRAILATFLHHGLRCEELCGLRVPHLRVFGKGSKIRYVPAHPLALQRIHDYLEAAGH